MIKRSAPIRRTAVRKRRTKPRPGRLEGQGLTDLRDAVWERDEGCCVACGNACIKDAPEEWPNSYHMAHRRGKRNWGDTLENTEINCGSCHRSFHERGPSREKIVPAKLPKS